MESGNNMNRKCSVCSQIFSLNEFVNNSSKKDGKDYRCKYCNRLLAKAYNKTHPEKVRAIQHRKYLRYIEADPDFLAKNYKRYYKQNLLSNARRRARLKGIEFDLSLEDIIISTVCPVLKIPLQPAFGTGKISPNSPTIDRIDLQQGYTKDNICIISDKANRIKNDATIEELEKVLEYMKGKK